MTLKKYALDYESCELAELHSMAQARCDPNVDMRRSKDYYVQMLVAADENATFDFEGLAPELRNHVYAELLHLRNHSQKPNAPGKVSCWPAILATSKLISKEATDILYGANVFEVKIFSERTTYYRMHIEINGCGFQHPAGSKLRDMTIAWPEYLRKVQKMKIFIDVQGDIPDRDLFNVSARYKKINVLLYSLSGFLATKRNMKKVDVQLLMKVDDIGELNGGMLWPLTKIGAQIDIEGLTKNSVEGSIGRTKPVLKTKVLETKSPADDQAILDVAIAKATQRIRTSTALICDTLGRAIVLDKKSASLIKLVYDVGRSHIREQILGPLYPVHHLLAKTDFVSDSVDRQLHYWNEHLQIVLEKDLEASVERAADDTTNRLARARAELADLNEKMKDVAEDS